MACYLSPRNQLCLLWRHFRLLGPRLSLAPEIRCSVYFRGARAFRYPHSFAVSRKGYSNVSVGLESDNSQIGSATPSPSKLGSFSEHERTMLKDMPDNKDVPYNLVNLRKSISNLNLSNGRVMLIDGNSVMYRSYYKLLDNRRVGIHSFTCGSEWLHSVQRLAEFHMVIPLPSPRMKVTMLKGNRIPTPDTVVQGLQYLKASIKAMSIKVIEVPGVEADDVIGTLAENSTAAGYKVRIVSPDKDFFQILSPSLRLLRLAPRGPEMVSFGVEEFTKKYGALKPSQFVDMISLLGDAGDNIPGSLENLLQSVDEIQEDRIKNALLANADTALLSKELATLRCDLPYYMVPCKIADLVFEKPEDNGEKFVRLMRAIGAYAEGFSVEPIIGRISYNIDNHV
ncbi:hypothetical protein QJS04_geneDACA015530 [Acorus gramineus]|uniref:5'-3' exonuclease domain-containing protein n=1 Tax=Acorus gramineus TaxID=55184 RepID=A0AAV9AQW8_ACOGR|nr:hypothetical protein QJS04_geneDACA015530 [Acorus gramineus]